MMKMKLVLCGIVCLLVSETCTQGFSNNFNGFGPPPGNSHLHAPQQVNNPFRRQTNDGFKQKPQQPHQHQQQQQQPLHQQQQPPHQHQQQQYFVQQAQSIEVPFNQKNSLNNQRPPSQGRFPVPNQFAPPQPKSNPVFQRSLENQLRIPQSPFQVLPSTQITNVLPKDQDFHSQNFLSLRNHVQNAGPTQQLPQRTQQQQFIQPQPQQQIQQQPQQQLQQQQQQQPFFQTAPQFPSKPKQQQPQQQPPPQSHQTSFNFQNIPLSSAGQFNFQPQTQQQQTFQKLPQVIQQQQFQPALQTTPQALPQIQSAPSFNENIQKFQAVPDFQQSQFIQPTLQQFQTAPQIGQIQQSFNQPQLQFQQPQQQPQFTTSPQIGRNPDQEYKQKLIQKHEQFVQKQYEKNQNKVQQLHQQFVQKQQQIKQQAPANIRFPIPTIGQVQSRPILPTETHLFENAVKKYHEEHPTTTTTTTTTPAPETTLTYTNIFQNHPNPNAPQKPGKTLSNDEILKQLKAALSENPQAGLGNKSFDAMDLVLANGQKVQVIRTSDPNLIKGQKTISQSQLADLQSGKTSEIKFENLAPESKKDFVLSNGNKVQIVRAPNPDDIVGTANVPAGVTGGLDLSSLANLYGGGAGASSGTSPAGNSISSAVIQSDSDSPPTIEELAKRGLIPDGYEIEGLSSKPKAKPKPTAPPKKKATYVYLEEQNDGSFKIQGVKANGEKETKTTGSEVESILNRIRSGEIKLPPSVKKLTLPNDEEVYIDAIVNGGAIVSSSTLGTTTTTTPKPFTTTRRPHVVRSSYSPSATTASPVYTYRTSGHVASASTTYQTTAIPRSSPQYVSPSTYRPVTEKLTATPTPVPQPPVPELTSDPTENLIQILKSKELFAMAKYLRQSGLDKILNETGPYTVFVPTDKAFKNLLVQLGGPERAEEKFKVNPRLLSGLLLHHVIPGSFEINDLQDEMTGVSLAGTQLRVNQYTMHDQEWNDVTITTINGAMVLNDRKDIKIPQGIAHAVDRVMFPLPVGDLLQTLQSDRDSRFSTFLKIVNAAEYNEKLQSKGVKTYTVFAPTEKAFEELDADVITKLTTDKDAALEFIEKHVVQGTLFSAGMRFYQVKDSLANGNSVILQKTSSGKIKVNDAHMVSSNIPATNGVIHAIDGLL